MNTKQILTKTGLTQIFKMVSSLSVIDAQVTDYDNDKSKYCVNGQMCDSKKINIVAATGTYSITVPDVLVNDFLHAMGVKMVQKELSELPTSVILLDSDIAPLIKNAAKFVGKDDMRPQMMCVCLTLRNGLLSIAATDAHRLYYSNWIGCGYKGKDKKVLIEGDYNAVKNASSIDFYADGTVSIGGVVFTLPDDRFPEYEAIIPQYEAYMEFDKKEFVKLVKGALKTTNKCTNQINFHLNGQIDINSVDLDFERESNFGMSYDFKNFKDTDISFDGKRLLSCLSVIPDAKVKMFTDGIPTRAVLINGTDADVLLMPIQI